MHSSKLDRLDSIAEAVKAGDYSRVGVLSTSERVYVALAANSSKLLKQQNYTIPEAMARLGWEDLQELVSRWEYKG